MEEDIHRYDSNGPKTKEKLEQVLEKAIDVAELRLKKETAADESLAQALSIIYEFLKDKKRVCYGGTAMNAILPDSKKFYDPKLDVPDYDFYTPDLEEDVKEIVDRLNAAGFKDVYHKYGMHDGTKKVLVNFVAVADITHINREIYDVLKRRSIVRDGVHYTDDMVLRMMMYLELSRPRGEVARWGKVFERLQLINNLFPIRGCGASKGENTQKVPCKIREKIIDFIIDNKRILCNGPVESMYSKGIRHRAAKYKMEEGGPIFLTSSDAKADALTLKRLISSDIVLFRHHAKGEIVPERIELRLDGKMIALIIQENACHSYRSIPVSDGRTIYIGSIEFLITLYLSMYIFTNQARDILGSNVPCRVKTLIGLSKKNYTAKASQFSPFALECRGHQVSYQSLLKKKVNRIKKERGEGSLTRRVRATKRGTKKRKSE